MPSSEHDPNADAMRAQFNDIARLDLAAPRPGCECKCTGVEPHADRLCHAPATMMVVLHRWGWCDQPGEDPNFDQDGNLCALMCTACASHAATVAASKIRQLLANGGDPHCPTCGRDTNTWRDILKRRSL